MYLVIIVEYHYVHMFVEVKALQALCYLFNIFDSKYSLCVYPMSINEQLRY